MATLELDNVHKSFGSTEVIKDMTLSVNDGELVVFVGPSGCGKSTMLRMIAGLETLSRGEIRIGGKRVDHEPPSNRGIAMVFQSYALYPHKNVRGNLGFALKHAKVPTEEIDRRVNTAADILGLDELMERKPRELSGGQRQRVAIGRAKSIEELLPWHAPLCANQKCFCLTNHYPTLMRLCAFTCVLKFSSCISA